MNWIMDIKRRSRDKREYILQILMDKGNVEMKDIANIENLTDTKDTGEIVGERGERLYSRNRRIQRYLRIFDNI